MSYVTGLFSPLTFQEIKPQSHYNHGYNEIVSRKSHVDDYSTWDIVKATQWVDSLIFTSDGANPIGNFRSTTNVCTLTLSAEMIHKRILVLGSSGASKPFHITCQPCVHAKHRKARQQRAVFTSHSQEAQAPSQHTISLKTTILIQGIEKSHVDLFLGWDLTCKLDFLFSYCHFWPHTYLKLPFGM